MIKSSINKKNGVYIASKPMEAFSEAYLKVREKEGRLYTDEEVKQLLHLPSSHRHAAEWKQRKRSLKRFTNYLGEHSFDYLLEIGCGNGWFSYACSEEVNNTIGVDINLTELEQAARTLKHSNIDYVYWDIFDEYPFNVKFDLVVFNASIQYFKELKPLFHRVKELLTTNGELHILDSPFYEVEAIPAAKARSSAYYEEQGFSEMAEHYFHHDVNQLRNFDQLYHPPQSKWAKFWRGKDMPFGWYRIKRKDLS